MAPKSPLSREAVGRSLLELRYRLKRTDYNHLRAIVTLMAQDGRIRIIDVMSNLYPRRGRAAALTSFRQLCQRLKTVSSETSTTLNLEMDDHQTVPLEDLWCWFVGDDAAAQAAEKFAAAETSGVERSQQNAEELDVSGKRLVRYFVSYAHSDRKLKDDLFKSLKHLFDSAKHYRFVGWQDGDIVLGSRWGEQIDEAIRNCDFGLLMVSPAFLASKFISQNELPHFVTGSRLRLKASKIAAPVALKSIPFDGTIDLKGLEERQIFRDKDGKAFQQRTTVATKDQFANELFAGISRMLSLAVSTEAAGEKIRKGPASDPDSLLRENIEHELADINFIRTQGQIDTLDKVRGAVPWAERRDALEFLLQWARDPEGQCYCALLGEYGMGKTTTSMAFAQALLEARQNEPRGVPTRGPLPIYLDLRNLGESAKLEPHLTTIVDKILQKSWRGGQDEVSLSASEVVRLVQQDGAVVIFDGLDEVLVHLSPAAGQRFTREIFRILPPALLPRRRKPDALGTPGRVLVTCRTHYFRTLRDQKTHLTAENRDDVQPDDYRVFVLLPFTDRQIHAYLDQTLQGEDIDRVMETIRAVHNLSELAARPYTLSLIAKHIPEIERWKLAGRRVSGVDLYRHMVLSWLERDAGKHQITPEHKQMFMEYFAASLWRSRKRAWSIGDVEQWLIDFVRARPALAAHYEGKDRELLKEDLRTATFLVREGESDFRFAHTSLQEFFLASYLHRALLDGRIEDWEMPPPSRETLDFLGQLLSSQESDAALDTLRMMRSAYRPHVSERALEYMLFAQDKRYSTPSLAGFRLDEADLRQLNIIGPSNSPPINLRGASFRGARVTGASFKNVDLEGADFSGANLSRSEMLHCRLRTASFAGAELSGTIFRDAGFDGATFAGSKLYRTQFLKCRLADTHGLGVVAPTAFFALCNPATLNGVMRGSSARVEVRDGHSGAVTCCAFSPDGTRVASGSADRSLRVWDVQSGECLGDMRGHRGGLFACAFSPDGSRLITASDDRTLRLWNLQSGESLLELRGHNGSILGCAFSPDGTRVASASKDGTARVWDISAGTHTLELLGHKGVVSSCVFSPDGKKLASASWDRTLRIWDATSGDCLTELTGHKNSATSCVFFPDGMHLASASDDHTLRLWEVDTGECVAELIGHNTWVKSCAISSDGTRLISTSTDSTVRLWDTGSRECTAVLYGHQSGGLGCAFSPDGKYSASAGEDETLRLWDVASRECLTVLRGHPYKVSNCLFSRDSQRLLLDFGGGLLRVWNTASGECIEELPDQNRDVLGYDVLADGTSMIIVPYHGGLEIRATASDDRVLQLKGHADVAAFSLDGTRLASGSRDGALQIWDRLSGKCLLELDAQRGGVSALVFSPDGKFLASISPENTSKIWDLSSAKCIKERTSRSGTVIGCAFVGESMKIAFSFPDGRIRISDAMSGECYLEFSGHQGKVIGGALSPDCRCLALLSSDGTLLVWDVATDPQLRFRIQFFQNGSWACLDLVTNRVVEVFGDAWRRLGWFAADLNGHMIHYPIEASGVLAEVNFLDADPRT
jgi:WD40 repeat protein